MAIHAFQYAQNSSLVYVGGVAGTSRTVLSTSFTLPTTSTAAAGMVSWVNPLATAVWASVDIRWSTAGTGSFDMGISDDGTGSSNAIIDGGTMALGTVSAIRSAATLGASGPAFYIAANGTAGDSIVALHSDTPTSTAVGKATINYWPA